MTQMNAPFDQTYEQPGEAPRTSGLAVWSLICSIVLCCPVTTVLGVLLGLAAMFTISGNPAKKGKGLAIAGILLGVIFTAAWGVGGVWVGGFISETSDLMLRKAPEAVVFGVNEDYAGFKAAMYGDAAAASNDEIKAFFEEIESRYGELQACSFDDTTPAPPPQPGSPIISFPYRFDCANETVSGELEFVLVEPGTYNRVMAVSRITVFDSQRGDLVFPDVPPLDNAEGDAGEAVDEVVDEAVDDVVDEAVDDVVNEAGGDDG